MDNRKEAIVNALRAFIAQRPGIEPGNYGDWRAYRRESAQVTRDRKDAETLLSAVAWRDSITADDILKDAQSGRLTIEESIGAHSGQYCARVSYCAGQYFPTEYRRAVTRLLASVLWAHTRDHCMPEGSRQGATDGAMLYRNPTGRGHVTGGDWLRRHFRKEFGGHIANRYFD